jgi:hypothetical protein
MFDRLDAYEKGGITYFKILVDTVFKMSSLTVKSLKQIIANFGKDGLSKVQGENVRIIGTLIIAVATCLADCGNLGFESYQHVVDGLSKCNVAKFRDVYRQQSAALTFEDCWNLNGPDFTTVNLTKHWNQVTMSHCSNWQRDVNDHAVNEDYESSIWMRELLEGCLDSELQKQVNDKFERLDAYEKGGITYFKILVDTVFKMSSLTVKSLKQFIADFGKDGLSKVQGENVCHIGTLIISVATCLADCGNLGFESYQHVVDGLSKCNVAKFCDVYRQKSATLTLEDALHGFGDMNSDVVMKKIKGVLHPAMNIYDNLNLGRQWNVSGRSANALPVACDNCGGPHTANKCPQPRDEEKCKKA